MPKKTLKQKLSAQKHRHDETLHTHTYSLSSSTLNTTPPSPIRTASSHIHTSDYGYVRKDLIKIMIFTCLAMIGNGVLYFLGRR